MISKKNFTLKFKIIPLLICSALLAVGVYYAASTIGYSQIASRYQTQEAQQARIRKAVTEFQIYVKANNLSSRDMEAISAWTVSQDYVSLVLFKDGRPKFQSGSAGASEFSNSQPTDYYREYYDAYSLSPVLFSDGIYQVSVDEYSYVRLYTICEIASLILAFATMLTCVLIYIRRLTTRIKKLSVAAKEIENGNLDYPVPEGGNDEISVLAAGMNTMRVSVKERIQGETTARRANADLVTAMSHDIRTPLTTLIGYLELLQSKAYSSESQREDYVNSAHDKAMRLKELTDELFRYFLVYDESDIPVNIEEFDSAILIEQLLGEPIIELRNSGRRVIVNSTRAGCTILADVMCLKRVFDNVFSNVKKHSDPNKPVIILVQPENDNALHICVTNSIPPTPNLVESTRVGLKTCSKLMRSMGGNFTTVLDGNKFMAEIVVLIKI